MTIEVKHKLPVTVDTVQVTLPFFYKCGKYAPHYCWVQPHDDADEITDRLEREFCDPEYAPIDEAVFHHKFSESHREVFYMVNPQLRPKI